MHKIADDVDDETFFEISLINKNNKCINIDANVKEGQIQFNSLKLLNEGGVQYSRKPFFDRAKGGKLGKTKLDG